MSIPTVNALKAKNMDKNIVVNCFSKVHKEIYLNYKHIYYFIYVPNFIVPIYMSYIKISKIKPFMFNSANYLQSVLFYETKAIDLIAEIAGLNLENKQIQVYLTIEEEKNAKKILADYINPVVIHTTSLTSKNQEWPLENCKELIKKNKDLTFIQLGTLNEEKVDGVVDLSGKTTFRGAFAIIKHSKS